MLRACAVAARLRVELLRSFSKLVGMVAVTW
jgi:hypothetical protein